MRFTKVYFEENSPNMKGLKKIDLSSKPLGSVIALAGKNGSGKSRILELIEKFSSNLNAENLINNEIVYIPNVNANNQIYANTAKTLQSQVNRVSRSQLLRDATNIIASYREIITPYIKTIDTNIISTINKNINVVYEELLKEKPLLENNFDFLAAFSNLSYFQKISDELNLDRYNILAEGEPISKIEEKDSYNKFEKFKFYFEKFLGKKIISKAKKIATGEIFSSDIMVNGSIINPALFSPGESILFCYAVLFFLMDINTKNGLENCILIIDEPENHLHPSAQIQVISTIKEIIKDRGQLWLATHSLPLLSSLDADEIFIVKNDSIVPPNRYNPGNSIIELMESEENSFRIKEFLISSSDWAYSNFMTQCFIDPDVHFVAAKDDKQVSLFRNLIESQSNLTILDYGAGKGRLAKVFEENAVLNKKIDFYCALEPDPAYVKELDNINFIKEKYTAPELIPDNFFDFVLLFNVLHEISPEEWIPIFKAIKRCLKETGFLIIVEDKFLPKGEKINKYGYLILNEHQILDLFQLDHQMLDTINPLKNNADNRITFSVILKNQIDVTKKSILLAITNLGLEIFGKMEEARMVIENESKAQKDLSIGRKYAHYSQLYINTKIAEKNLPDELDRIFP